jgi:hypothetical protein
MPKDWTKKFDAQIAPVVSQRGETYGHPSDDFRRASALKDIVRECPDTEVRHALEMICVKLARLINRPTHFDSVVDIAGYARTIAMIMDSRGDCDE